MGDPKHPQVGDRVIDASDVALIDVTPDYIRKLTKVREGFDQAVMNAANLKPAVVERAGLNPKDIQRAAELLARDQRISELLPAAEKLVEMLHETRQQGRHEIAVLLGEFAAQARRRAEHAKNPGEILGPMDALLAYQYGPAMKAVATKEKSKAAKAAQKTSPEGKDEG